LPLQAFGFGLPALAVAEVLHTVSAARRRAAAVLLLSAAKGYTCYTASVKHEEGGKTTAATKWEALRCNRNVTVKD